VNRWLKRVRGAIGMGLTWAAGWAGVGMVIELIWNIFPGFPLGPLVDIWPAALGIPGLVGGLAFSGVLRIAAGRRRFDELSLPSFAAWGAVAGVFLGLLPLAISEPNLARMAALTAFTTVLCTVSATASLALARTVEDKELLDASSEVADVGLTRGEAKKLLG
jgi:hypothetical protein